MGLVTRDAGGINSGQRNAPALKGRAPFSCLLTARIIMQQFRVSTEAIAALYGIQLPRPEDLPPSYPNVRKWLAHRVRTLQGANKEAWQRARADPEKMQGVRAANLQRARAYRERRAMMEAAAPRPTPAGVDHNCGGKT